MSRIRCLCHSCYVRVICVLFFFLLPFQTQWILREGMIAGQRWEYGTVGAYATDALLLLTIVGMRWRWWKQYDLRFKIYDLRFPIVVSIAAMVWIFASTFWAMDWVVALVHAVWIVEAMALALVVMSYHNRSLLLRSFVFISSIQAMIGLWQFFSQSTIASTVLGWAVHPAWQSGTSVIEAVGERWIRAYASFPHPNIFGGWMAVTILLVLNQYTLSSSKRQRSLMSVVLVLLSAGLAVSFSRSAWIAAIIGIVVLSASLPLKLRGSCLPAGKAGRELCSAVAIILLSVSAILFPYRTLLQTRVQSTARLEQQSLTERARGYQDAITLIKQHPLLGVGLGNFTSAVAQQDRERPLWGIQPVHNVFLLIFAELGVVGIGLTLLILRTVIARSCSDLPAGRQAKQSRNVVGIATPRLGGARNDENRLLYSLFSILLVLSFTDHYLWSLHPGLLLLGFTLGITGRREDVSAPLTRPCFFL